MEKLDQTYRTYLRDEGKSPSSQASYSQDVKQFLEWLSDKGNKDIKELSRFHVLGYKKELQRKYKLTTYNTKINSLIHFNKFLLEKGYIEKEVFLRRKDRIKIAKGSERQVEVFKEEEIERFLYYIYSEQASKREKVIVLFLLYTGVRVSELTNIRVEDVDLLTRQVKVIGKGGKYREIPLKAELVEAIVDYMKTERKENKLSTSPYLLVSERSPQLHRDTILSQVKSLGNKLGIKAYPHKFRHTFCTQLIRKNIAISTVANLAGHANIQTTLDHYINTSQEEKEKAIEEL